MPAGPVWFCALGRQITLGAVVRDPSVRKISEGDTLTMIDCFSDSSWTTELSALLHSINPGLVSLTALLIANGFVDRSALSYLDRDSCTEMKIPIAQRNMLMAAVEKLVRDRLVVCNRVTCVLLIEARVLPLLWRRKLPQRRAPPATRARRRRCLRAGARPPRCLPAPTTTPTATRTTDIPRGLVVPCFHDEACCPTFPTTRCSTSTPPCTAATSAERQRQRQRQRQRLPRPWPLLLPRPISFTGGVAAAPRPLLFRRPRNPGRAHRRPACPVSDTTVTMAQLAIVRAPPSTTRIRIPQPAPMAADPRAQAPPPGGPIGFPPRGRGRRSPPEVRPTPPPRHRRAKAGHGRHSARLGLTVVAATVGVQHVGEAGVAAMVAQGRTAPSLCLCRPLAWPPRQCGTN